MDCGTAVPNSPERVRPRIQFDGCRVAVAVATLYILITKFFFAEAGFPCPTRRNPSDHFFQCTNSGFDVVTEVLMESQRICETQNPLGPIRNLPTSEIKGILIKKCRCSEYATRTRSRIQGISSIEGLEFKRNNGSQAKWWKQLSILTQRSSLNMSRDFGYYWLRIAIYIILSICVGSIFYDVGTNYTAIYARDSCASFISGFMTFMSIGGFPSFIEEMRVK